MAVGTHESKSDSKLTRGRCVYGAADKIESGRVSWPWAHMKANPKISSLEGDLNGAAGGSRMGE